MAEGKKMQTGKKVSITKTQKVINVFKTLPMRIAKPFKHMWHELRLVSWPSKNELINYSMIVLVFIALMSLVVGVLDISSTALIQAIIG